MEEFAREYISFARQLSASGSYSKAFDFYMIAFEKCADLKSSHESEFRVVMSILNEILVSANKMEDIFENFKRTLEFFPNNVYFLNDIGKYLYKYAFYNEAWYHFEKALMLDSGYVEPERNLNSLKNLLIERWHFRMLNDKIRNNAYRTAIRELVNPHKDCVLDLGTGTGLLAMYAKECQPLDLVACEDSELMTKLAEAVTQDNGHEDIAIINKLSTQMNYRDTGGKRSLLITEMFDAGLFGEHVLQALSHAWKYLMTNAGRVIPNKAEFFVIGAKCDFLCHKYQMCPSIKTLLNISTLNVHVELNDETYDCEDVHLFGDDLKYMTESTSLMKIDFNSAQDIQDALNRTDAYKINLRVLESGEINVYIGWFNLYLTDNVTITTDPRSETRANAWQQPVFFDNIHKQVAEHDIIDARFLINGGKLTMLPEKDCTISRISPQTLRFLNDIEFMNLISGCIGMACVYLGQMAEMSQISIVDLCPFPMFGLQLLKRGIQSLICCAKTDNDKLFFENVFKANDITSSNITILVGDNWTQEVFKEEFHAIFCNIFENCGEIDLRVKEIGENLKQNHLLPGGLFMPANVKLMGQIVYSHWLDINNRLFDKNVNNFKIAEYMNKFQVTQDYCIDLSHLEYTPLSDPRALRTFSSPHGREIVTVPIIQNGHTSAILCWYIIELMDNFNEISTNRKNSFVNGVAFIPSPNVELCIGDLANLLCCVDSDGAFKVMITDMP